MNRLRARLGEDRGLSLAEVLIAMLIAALLGGAVVTGVGQALRAADRNQRRVVALGELQVVAERMSRELRAANPVEVAERNRVQVAVRRAGQDRSYRYELVAMPSPSARNQVQEVRTVSGVTTTTLLAEEIDAGALELRYYDGAGQELSVPMGATERVRIQRIRITLTRFIPMNSDPITVETTVSVRNRA